MQVYTTGTRVQLHPATDAWMSGDQFGEIVEQRGFTEGKFVYLVRMDRSGRVRRVAQRNIKYSS